MLTQELADKIATFPLDAIPEQVLHEAKRSFLNWLGVAVGASHHPSMDMALNVAASLGSASQASILGRGVKTDLLFATLLNGMSSHIFDYDDTFLDTILHPSAPVFPALLAWAEHQGVAGRPFLQAFVLGVEVEQRIAQAIYPSHYDRGWHITGSVGAFGAAAGLCRLMGLSPQHAANALGIAATQPTGLREMFGTMTKPFHPGKAAANGLLAALLAREGFTSSASALEANRGFLAVVCENPDPAPVAAPWGEKWQLVNNTYKPYACGVVTHPAIDAGVRLHRAGITDAMVESIVLEVHPLVLELTGKKEPRTQLEAKFSVYHCTAVGIIDGAATEWQFAAEKVLDARVIGLRRKITAVVNRQLAENQAVLKATLKTGETRTEVVDACLGSRGNPLSDRDLEEKFLNLTRPLLDDAAQREIIERVWGLDREANLSRITGLCQPERR